MEYLSNFLYLNKYIIYILKKYIMYFYERTYKMDVLQSVFIAIAVGIVLLIAVTVICCCIISADFGHMIEREREYEEWRHKNFK